VQQLGCGASGPPAAAVRVKAAPPLPVATVVGFVLTTATTVLVKNVVPGAQVTLFVNGLARGAPVDSIEAEAAPPTGTPPLMEVSVPVGWPPLVAGAPVSTSDVLTAGQALCGVNKLPSRKGGGVTVQTPLPAPAKSQGEPGGALGSNNNYFMYTPASGGGCANLINVSVTLTVTETVVWKSTGGPNLCAGGGPLQNGLSLQMNCYSPKGKYCAWQQYIINLWGTQLLGAINTWPLSGGPIILAPNSEFTTALSPSPPSVEIPAGYVLTITLGNDSLGNVINISWTVNGGTPVKQNIPSLLAAARDRDRADRRLHAEPGRPGLRRERGHLVGRGDAQLFGEERPHGVKRRALDMRRVHHFHRRNGHHLLRRLAGEPGEPVLPVLRRQRRHAADQQILARASADAVREAAMPR
jgi:hypothetical protein